jgi:hypothetical protein
MLTRHDEWPFHITASFRITTSGFDNKSISPIAVFATLLLPATNSRLSGVTNNRTLSPNPAAIAAALPSVDALSLMTKSKSLTGLQKNTVSTINGHVSRVVTNHKRGISAFFAIHICRLYSIQ